MVFAKLSVDAKATKIVGPVKSAGKALLAPKLVKMSAAQLFAPAMLFVLLMITEATASVEVASKAIRTTGKDVLLP